MSKFILPRSWNCQVHTCPESLPFGKFLLTCVASKPEIVVPELEVIWLHNGVERTDNSDIVTNGTHIVI